MTVQIRYDGNTYQLDAKYHGYDIENVITVTQNRFARDIRSDRPDRSEEGRPFVGFLLAGGGTVSFPVNDAMRIAVIDTNSDTDSLWVGDVIN